MIKLRKPVKKIRSSQDFILTNSCTELSFSLGVLLSNILGIQKGSKRQTRTLKGAFRLR